MPWKDSPPGVLGKAAGEWQNCRYVTAGRSLLSTLIQTGTESYRYQATQSERAGSQ
ncbi:hypothetical protein [Streptomyces sp. NPDC059708]|uniref:hypothetical protein n=1 Tax=Streptomyces sp. NPDC059708 TaxID=3346916 RepID=UPI0036AC7824